MFAVPGWSVASDKLKAETTRDAPATAETGDVKAGGKKRKRQPNQAVSAENVAELWDKVVEGKGAKKRKRTRKTAASQAPGDESEKEVKAKDDEVPQESAPAQEVESSVREKKKDKKSKKDKTGKQSAEKNSAHVQDDDVPRPKKSPTEKTKDKAQDSSSLTKPPPQPPAPAPKPPALTPLQKAMRDKLVSARFRHLNEALYTKPSADALRMFQDSPDMFTEYHEGFRRQVQVWPENPVDTFIRLVRQRAKIRPAHLAARSGGARPEKGAASEAPSGEALPLPRTDGICTIADLGCGDARLAEVLWGAKKKLRVEIMSFDLHSPSERVTRADIANLELKDGAVDVAIFCLALMGTNWLDFIEEAYRILRWKGELWVAEIKSRFARGGGAKAGKGRDVVDHSVGKRRKAPAKKKSNDDDEAVNEDEANAALAVEVDGASELKQETDASAFVDALNKRGFVLQGERSEAVDLSNKMFVRMHFVKAMQPVKGKCVITDEARAGKKLKARLAEVGDDQEVGEGVILKPCVYKLR